MPIFQTNHAGMPQHKSAAKRVRQNARARVRNRIHRSRVRTMVKKVLHSEDHGEATVAFPAVQSYLDRLATKGVIHRNKAANYKRQMQRRIQALSSV